METQTAMLDLNLKKLKQGDTSVKVLSLKTISFQISGDNTLSTNLIDLILNHLDKPLQTSSNQSPISQSQLPIVATTLLQQLFQHCSNTNQSIITQKLLKFVIKNLGDENMQLRKLSHRCLVQYVRKFRNFDSIIQNYLDESLMNDEASVQLKQKTINSLQSILILEYKALNLKSSITKQVFQVLIKMANQNNKEIKKASVHCLITLSKIPGFKALLKTISKQSVKKLQYLGEQSVELHELLTQQVRYPLEIEIQRKLDYSDGKLFMTPINVEMKKGTIKNLLSQYNSTGNNNYNLHLLKVHRKSEQKPKTLTKSIKIFPSGGQILEAEQMLKLIELSNIDESSLKKIQAFIPILQTNFNDKRTQMFNLSIRTIQAIFEIKIAQSRFYIKLVPSVVQRLNDQKFTIRNTIMKLIKQYIENYTVIWIQNFFNYLKSTFNVGFKEDIINMLIYGYESIKDIKFDEKNALIILCKQVQEKRKSLKNKALHCMVLIILNLKANSSHQLSDYQLIKPMIPEDVIAQVMMRIGDYRRSKRPSKTEQSVILQDPFQYTFKSKNNSVGVVEILDKPKQSQYNMAKKYNSLRKQDKYNDDREESSVSQNEQRYDYERKMKIKSQQSTEKLQRNSIKFRNIIIGSPKRKSKSNYTSLNPLNSSHQSQTQISQALQIKPLADPAKQSAQILTRLRDKSWKTQYLAIGIMRSLNQFHQQNLWQILDSSMEDLLKGILSLRSIISKNCLICLDDIMCKFKKRMQPYLQSIVECLLKKSSYANEFLQQQVRKCFRTITNVLSDSKLIHIIHQYQQNKASSSTNVKISILLLIENLMKNQKLYKKQIAYFWSILISLIQESSFEVRDQAKRIIYALIELYPNWRTDLSKNQKSQRGNLHLLSNDKNYLQRRIIALIEKSPKSLSKTPPHHGKQQHYLNRSPSHQYQNNGKIQDIERACNNFKDWKHRINAIKQLFKQIQKNPKQFYESANYNRYINILFQHLQDPNPKVVSNALNILDSILQPSFQSLVEERLNKILGSLLAGMSSIRLQVYNKSQQVYSNLRKTVDQNKIIKQLAKLLTHPNQKIKMKASRQLSQILPNQKQQYSNIQKTLNRIMQQQRNVQVQGSVKGLLQIIR